MSCSTSRTIMARALGACVVFAALLHILQAGRDDDACSRARGLSALDSCVLRGVAVLLLLFPVKGLCTLRVLACSALWEWYIEDESA